MEPPKTAQKSYIMTTHGDTRVDPYFWLRERKNPEAIEYLKAENQHTDAIMASTCSLQETLFKEMKARIKETDESVPSRFYGYDYYIRTEAGKQYPIHCRRKIGPGAVEEILLDENELARGHEHFRLGVFEVSPDGMLLVYSVDTKGSEQYVIFVKNLATGEVSTERIPNTHASLAWANDSKTFFYITLDAAYRPYKLFRHYIGTGVGEDELVHEEKDKLFHMNVDVTRSKRFIMLELASQITTEIWYLDADHPEGTFACFRERMMGVEYSLEHGDGCWYILTNEHAKHFKVMRASTAAADPQVWKEIIPHDPRRTIESVDAFKEFLAVAERWGVERRLLIIDVINEERHYVEFPDEPHTFWYEDNEEFNDDWLRFVYSSLTIPDTVYDYHVRTRERILKKREEVSGYNSEDFVSERIWARGADGAWVPISLVYKKGIKKDGTNPVWLYGYGSYGITVDPQFYAMRVSLLERGVVYATAHVRGGGDLGRSWYEDGKFLKKKNTFTDYIACAEHLIQEGYTSAGKVIAYGGSAGGLLMGAVVNMRPDLFAAVIASVPFVDTLNTMLDPSLPLTVHEYEEWGNPQEKKFYDYIKSYAPYENVRAQAYPAMLILAGLNDPRVAYWEPAKFVARLRRMKTDSNLLLLKTKMDAGHFGASGRYDFLKEIAFNYAFALKVLKAGRL